MTVPTKTHCRARPSVLPFCEPVPKVVGNCSRDPGGGVAPSHRSIGVNEPANGTGGPATSAARAEGRPDQADHRRSSQPSPWRAASQPEDRFFTFLQDRPSIEVVNRPAQQTPAHSSGNHHHAANPLITAIVVCVLLNRSTSPAVYR